MQLQDRQQNNWLLIAGVSAVLISLLVRVPLWMWAVVLALAGAVAAVAGAIVLALAGAVAATAWHAHRD